MYAQVFLNGWGMTADLFHEAAREQHFRVNEYEGKTLLELESLDQLRKLAKLFDVMVLTRHNQLHIYLDTKGGLFRQR